ASSGGAAFPKLGRLPFAVSAMSVNWETTSTAPPASSTDRSNLPSAPAKTRSRATLPASRVASSSPSSRATPRSTHRPGPIAPPGVTCARATRCTTAFTGEQLLEVEDPRPVLLRPRPERARELVVAVRLGLLTLLFEAATERVVGVVVHGRELEHHPELGLGL